MEPVFCGALQLAIGGRGLALQGNTAFIPGYEGLLVVDIGDPAYPYLIGEVGITGIASNVFLEGDYAYLANHRGGMQVIDVSDLTSPRWIGELDNGLSFSDQCPVNNLSTHNQCL